jgi:TatD DNase family protein
VLIDTHCHLDAAEFDADREAVIAAATVAGVEQFVVPAVERANFAAVASLCRTYPQCRPAYGIHPMYVANAREDDLLALRDAIARQQPVAVGEIGLDRFVENRDDARQEFYFVEQLHIAREAGLPVLLHVRRAIDQVLMHLRRIKLVGGIAHAFNGSRQQADEFLKLGFKLGFGGAMTYPRSSRIRELAATLPDEAIVLETDAPDIAPAWQSGVRHAPEQLPRIAEVLAQLRDTTYQQILAITSANARSVLPRLAYPAHHGQS